MKPRISIITITWNSEQYVEETIKSVISQDYENMEYIIVDGASTDKTLEIINRYKEHVDILISEPDKGISDAFNKGIKKATGDIIGIINSDDLLLSGAIQKIANVYEEDIDIYRCNEIIWNVESGAKFQEKPSMSFSPTNVLVHVTHESSFVRKSTYEKYGAYDEHLHFIMDLDFLTRAYMQGAKMKYVDYDAAIFRLGGKTDSPLSKKKREYAIVAKKNGADKWSTKLYILRLTIFDWMKKALDIISPDLKKRIRLHIQKSQ